MWESSHRILVVGRHEAFAEIFDHLEASENYDLHYAPDFESARASLRRELPSAIILALPRSEQNTLTTLAWLSTVKGLAPLLVLSPVDDVDLYIEAMEHGAFDFLTPTMPFEEVDRQLSSALTWHTRQAA